MLRLFPFLSEVLRLLLHLLSIAVVVLLLYYGAAGENPFRIFIFGSLAVPYIAVCLHPLAQYNFLRFICSGENESRRRRQQVACGL